MPAKFAIKSSKRKRSPPWMRRISSWSPAAETACPSTNSNTAAETVKFRVNDARPYIVGSPIAASRCRRSSSLSILSQGMPRGASRSEEHTSELQSRGHLVCRLLLEKKKEQKYRYSLYKKKKTKNKN